MPELMSSELELRRIQWLSVYPLQGLSHGELPSKTLRSPSPSCQTEANRAIRFTVRSASATPNAPSPMSPSVIRSTAPVSGMAEARSTSGPNGAMSGRAGEQTERADVHAEFAKSRGTS